MFKKPWWVIAMFALALFSCGEEYYSTPEKTLQRYINNKAFGSRQQAEATINCFTEADQEWWNKHYAKLCFELYGPQCPGETVQGESTVWTDKFEPAGPTSAEIEGEVEIDEDAGTAWITTTDGWDVEFKKERGNWKIVGLWGVPEEMEKQYPNIR